MTPEQYLTIKHEFLRNINIKKIVGVGFNIYNKEPIIVVNIRYKVIEKCRIIQTVEHTNKRLLIPYYYEHKSTKYKVLIKE